VRLEFDNWPVRGGRSASRDARPCGGDFWGISVTLFKDN